MSFTLHTQTWQTHTHTRIHTWHEIYNFSPVNNICSCLLIWQLAYLLSIFACEASRKRKYFVQFSDFKIKVFKQRLETPAGKMSILYTLLCQLAKTCIIYTIIVCAHICVFCIVYRTFQTISSQQQQHRKVCSFRGLFLRIIWDFLYINFYSIFLSSIYIFLLEFLPSIDYEQKWFKIV